jgi:hypothetical protein
MYVHGMTFAEFAKFGAEMAAAHAVTDPGFYVGIGTNEATVRFNTPGFDPTIYSRPKTLAPAEATLPTWLPYAAAAAAAAILLVAVKKPRGFGRFHRRGRR